VSSLRDYCLGAVPRVHHLAKVTHARAPAEGILNDELVVRVKHHLLTREVVVATRSTVEQLLKPSGAARRIR